jgi:serine/threonine protein kinase
MDGKGQAATPLYKKGQRVGQYEIIELLEQGRLTQLYLAQQVYRQNQVMVEVFQPPLLDELKESFRHQISSLIKLRHPYILRIIDGNLQSHYPYLVTEYRSHRAWGEVYPPGISQAFSTIAHQIEQLASALHYLHNQHVVHGAIRPENVWLDRHKNVHLRGFRIEAIEQNRERLKYQTAGVTKEAAGYTAPESAQGKTSPASDQYSLAAMIYELLCGTLPFTGTPLEIFYQQTHDSPPPLRKRAPAIAPEIESAVMKALEKDPERRYPDVQSFVSVLLQAQKEPGGDAIQRAPAQPTGVIEPPVVIRTSTERPKTMHPPRTPESAPAFPPPTPPAFPPARPQAAPGGQPNMPIATPPYQPPNAPMQHFQAYDAPTEQAPGYQPPNTPVVPPNYQRPAPPMGMQQPPQPYKAPMDAAPPFPPAPADYPAGAGSAPPPLPQINPPAPRRESGQKITRRVFAVGLVGLAAAGGAGGWYILSRRLTPAPLPTARSNSLSQATSTVIDNKKVLIFTGHLASVNAVAWSPDGKFIVSASDDTFVQIFDAQSGRRSVIYAGHTEEVTAVGWSPDGKFIASGGQDTTVQIWDAASGDKRLTFKGHTDRVNGVSWSKDSGSIASGSEDKSVQVWDATNGAVDFNFRGHTAGVLCVGWQPNSTSVASGSWDGTLRDWATVQHGEHFNAGDQIFNYGGHGKNEVYALAWSPDSNFIASAGADQTVQISNGSDGTPRPPFFTGHQSKQHVNAVLSVSWSPDGTTLASGDNDGNVYVWQVAGRKTTFIYRGHKGAVNAVAWSPDGKSIASASADGTVHVWQPS